MAVVVAAVILAIIVLPPGEEPGSNEPSVADDSPPTVIPTASEPSATPIPATTAPQRGPTTVPGAVPTKNPVTTLGITGRYVNPNDSSAFLEINPDGTFSWVLPEEGIDRRGVWTDDGGGIALDSRESLQTKRIEGRELFDPDGRSWEKYGDQGEVSGVYLRLNFEQLGEYVELLPDGSFVSEEGGVTSEGIWQTEGDEVTFSMDSDAALQTTLEEGAIIDADGVRWVKQ